jgi:hypothetical protein
MIFGCNLKFALNASSVPAGLRFLEIRRISIPVRRISVGVAIVEWGQSG